MTERQRNALLAFLVVAVLVVVVRLYLQERAAIPPGGTFPDGTPAIRGEYLFCFWNVENLFDDVDDARKARGDREYDAYFAGDPAALRQKLANLADVLLGMNAGRGPDILAVAEVESERAVELLQEALNGRLTDPALHYTGRAFADPSGGRNISTALLTRLTVEHDRTRLLGRRQRILEARVRVGASPLVVIASHWGSRVSDKAGTSRANYADAIYGRFNRLVHANPAVDLLVCGDFNDNPDDVSVVAHLHATGDLAAVRAAREPLLYNPFAPLYARGTASHYYGRKAYLFDQVCLSPGLLDSEGWSYIDGSAAIVAERADRQGRPIRFGGSADKRPLAVRGASDHFPVTVRLRVR
ncbi:MAG: hypothetical protein U0736_25515 [Gemmataceae bacterium]